MRAKVKKGQVRWPRLRTLVLWTIFLVTLSKPVQRKSAEDHPVATLECDVV